MVIHVHLNDVLIMIITIIIIIVSFIMCMYVRVKTHLDATVLLYFYPTM